MRNSTSIGGRVPARQVRALFDARTVTVYQAYSSAIAGPAIAAGRLVSPFKTDRMTWIKPSFLWMMYRSGWATKPDQERVLAISIIREGFEWALAMQASVTTTRPVQIGLTGEEARRYVNEWKVGIADVTRSAYEIHGLTAADCAVPTAARSDLTV